MTSMLMSNARPSSADTIHEIEIHRQSLRIPISLGTGETIHLQAEVIRPEGDGPFPLVTINHGVPRDESPENLKKTKVRFSKAAEWFTRRGFAVAVALRRGFGDSEGEYSEQSGPNDNRDYLAESRATAANMLEIIRFMQHQSFVDPTQVIVVGQSGGGLGALTIATDPPPGIRGVISFAGARGSKEPGMVCCEERLVEAMASLGSRNRLPGLWLFSENDHYFTPPLADRLFAAYSGASATKVTFTRLPPFGVDGHRVLYDADPAIWSGSVAAFLKELGL